VPFNHRPRLVLRRIGGAIGIGMTVVASVAGDHVRGHPTACESGISTAPAVSRSGVKGTAITASGISGVSATGTSGFTVYRAMWRHAKPIIELLVAALHARFRRWSRITKWSVDP
jgi:hypothetical protein